MNLRHFFWLLLVLPIGTPDPAVGDDGELDRLCADFWKDQLRATPLMATALGEHRYDALLPDITPEGIAREEKRLRATLARAREVDERALAAAGRLTRTALITDIEGQLAALECRFEEWVVDPLDGPQVAYMNVADYTRFATPEDGANYVKRVRAMGRALDDHVANLRRGLATGRTASQNAVNKVVAQLQQLAASPVESLAVWKPALEPHPEWKAEGDRFARDLRQAIEEDLRPGLGRYWSFLLMELLPVARPPDRAGLAALPGGADCYRNMIRVHTSLDLAPEAIHQVGLDEVARFRRELAALGERVFGTTDIPEIQRRLRADSAMHFRSAAEVEGTARAALARAQSRVSEWFGAIRPRAACEVRVMAMHEAPHSTIAYYRQPAADGSRPGYYMINTYKPETRPRYEAEALAFHEAVPGHHLQIAVAQELIGLPEFRKHSGVTAYVEGWALYTERLADEMGLYSGDIDRIGMLSYDAWRACRLVVDTGLHAMGWSRQQAIDYMVENTCLAENNIVNEVDRYLTWPGQALAYKLGQLEILKLREEARTRLGARFDIKAFHDTVLAQGAVALPVLRAQVEAWIAAGGAAR